ncbi:MAG TPA: prolipoprotein diacylglyceryl transferase family protein [Polyangiales bacterium]|nr:prolipoprotein diacylglyceryl transferase family protein [Polyangiales bacterium]
MLAHLHVGGQERLLGSYGLCLALALVLGGALALWHASRARLDVGATIAALGCAALAGFAGAYSLHVVVGCLHGLPLTAAATHPGIVFYGGALGALAGFVVAARALALPIAHTLDVITPALPFAQALGRVGCFLGGCCYGAASSGVLAVTYGDPLAPASHPAIARHPWPLYEAAALLVLGVLFTWLAPARRGESSAGSRGQHFASYVVAYALLRFALEPLRGDVVRGVLLHGAVSTSQLCAVLTLVAALLFIRARPRCT